MLWEKVRERQRFLSLGWLPQKKPGVMESHSQEQRGNEAPEVSMSLCVGCSCFLSSVQKQGTQDRNEMHVHTPGFHFQSSSPCTFKSRYAGQIHILCSICLFIV